MNLREILTDIHALEEELNEPFRCCKTPILTTSIFLRILSTTEFAHLG
jgi:hypothetical protein